MTSLQPVPLVSVVVPAYNAQRTIGATIASIVAQTVRDLEIVVVDDGSTDDTAAIVEADGIQNLRLVTQANAGHAAARNTGIAAARGQYVAFLDADDLWLPDKLERQLAELRKHPEIRAIQSGAVRVDDDLRVLWVEECQPSKDPLWDTLCFRNMPALMSTLLIERSLFDEVGAFDPELIILQDWDLAIRLARAGQLHSLPELLSAYRYHESQSANVEIHIQPGLRVLEKVFADPGLPPEIRARRNEVYARFYTMLSGGSVKVGRYGTALYWGARALSRSPRVAGYFLAFPERWARKRRHDSSLPESLPLPSTVLAANATANGWAQSIS